MMVVATSEKKMEIFGSVDKNRDGVVTSMYPAWYFTRQADDLREEIARLEHSLNAGLILDQNVPQERANLAKHKKQLERIEASRPGVSVGERDRLYKVYKELGAAIESSMFTRDDMLYGTADAHEEASRMADPCIELKGDALEMVVQCGGRVDKKSKVSRNAAAKAFKIIGKLIDEPSNIEVLRRNRLTQSVKVDGGK